MITTVVFDLDDTLYDELDYCKSGFNAVAHSLSNLVDVLSPEDIFDSLWQQFNAGNRTKTFNAALDDLGVHYDEKLIHKMVETYRSHHPKISLPADSEKVLKQLSGKYTLALLTDGFLPAQQLKVKALKIEKYFKCIICTEQLGREYWKPSPVGFEKILKKLNAAPQNTAYVADNVEKDFIAPNKLGFFTIQITRPARIHTSVANTTAAAPQYVIHEISQLPALLEKL
ncbi:MAG: HAD family hydrolase [Sedimentisphaerales bacterium]|nr:HAD family hydrolase [Sedimentisphaerales bacterium]